MNGSRMDRKFKNVNLSTYLQKHFFLIDYSRHFNKRRTTMRKFTSMFMIMMLTMVTLVACSAGKEDQGTTGEKSFKVGMMIDSGTIDDKSFNQGTWEAILRYTEDHKGVKGQHVQPNGETTSDYLSAADNLIMAGNEVIVAPGYKFEEAITELQTANSEVSFIILEGQPATMADNTLSIYFAEHQAGFLAGMAAALQSQTGKVGFIGGMKIPAVERFGWGYVAGVAYANKTYNTNVEVVDYQYQGTFNDVQGGQMMAGGMYDKGIDIIFSAAAAVGNGVINEAKARTESGEHVYVIGVDVDQYEEGLMNDGKSVILTSAIKRIDNAVYDALKAYGEGKFPGGEIISMDASTDGVGLPETNPNLTVETQEKVNETLAKIKEGQLVVPAIAEELDTFLSDAGYDAKTINYK